MIFKPYHKIRQYKDIVRDIQFRSNHTQVEKPVLKFKATTKLHGTNAGICYTPEKGVVAQKRSSLLKKENLTSHFGFNQFVLVEKKKFFEDLMVEVFDCYCRRGDQITFYGEWAGTGIQKSVGISQLEKAFYIFDCKIYNQETDTEKWIDISGWSFKTDKVFNIHQFTTWSLDIDFDQAATFQNKLIEITDKIEKECPVSRELGIESGIGEGAVWTSYWKGDKYIFKVKGEKHSTTRVKKLASIDPEVLNSINDFVNFACTENRIDQGIFETKAIEKKDVPTLMRWVTNDIIAEETDTLVANKLEWKQVAREVSNRIRQYFFKKLDTV